MITKTDSLTAEELATLTAENVDQFIERLKAHDARFSYEVVFAKDLKPSPKTAAPDLIVSVTRDSRTINVYARDKEAIDRNPPKEHSFTL